MVSNDSLEKEISDLKYKLDQMEDEKETLQIKIAEQELYLMEQLDL